MSLVSTLTKVAVGMVVAKGVKGMMGGANSQSGGLSDLLGSLMGGGQQDGGLGGLLGQLAGGQQRSGRMGGLGDILGSLAGNGSSSGGLGDIAGMLTGAQGGMSGGLGGLLDSLGGGSQASEGLGGLLNNVLQGQPVSPTPDQEKQAEIMLRAMINAAKADGEIDAQEQQKIAEHLDDITPDEVELVKSLMKEPNDLQALAASIPQGMEQQAYFMSLLAIDLDNQSEARYLQDLAQALNLSPEECNRIHEKLGEPLLFA